jgi:hypothetical protein
MAPIVEQTNSYVLMTLALIGKFFASVQFAVIYLHTPELYPTACRSTGLGTSSTVARIAGMIAPELVHLTLIWPPFLVVTLGLCGLMNAALIQLLPDTTGQELPQTMGENSLVHHTCKLMLPPATKCRRRALSCLSNDIEKNPDDDSERGPVQSMNRFSILMNNKSEKQRRDMFLWYLGANTF